MAKECGWTKDYIAKNLTLPQISRYYDVLYKEKLQDLKLHTIAMAQATARGFGGKPESFNKFLDSLDAKPKDVNKDLDSFKNKHPNLIEEK